MNGSAGRIMVSGADVTVIMPAYRAEATIGRALTSIARQSAPPARVIVVDDGSDDGTAAEVERHRDVLGAIELTLLRQANQGPGAARNLALAAAETELVAFLDADDEWMPEKLARVLPDIADPATVLVFHDMIVVDGQRERRTNGARHFRRDRDVYAALFERGFIATSTVVARTAMLRDGGGFEASLPAGQDYEMWLRVARDHGTGIAVVAEALTRYHVVPGSITSDVRRRRTCALRIAARHAPQVGRRKGGAMGVVVKRAAIISYEAWSGHWSRGDRLSAISALCKFPLALAAIIAGETN